MSTRFIAPALMLLAAAGCGDPTTLGPDVQARLRNDLPATCTMERQTACPAIDIKACPPGQEPVIDFSADCCGHFTCQPLCSAGANRMCPMTPAPICPAGTKLWIGTAIQDCCPAYRCESDGGCDPAKGEMCGCDETNAACTLALPYCGPNVMPIVVGQTGDCCPIYQCPCDKAVDATGVPLPPDAIGRCGCTYPNCQAGEELVCAGVDNCMGPCACRPARGICKDDSTCAAGEKCDVSACRLPPMTTTTADPMRQECDPLKCGPQLGLPVGMCRGRRHLRPDRALPVQRRRHLRLGGARLSAGAGLLRHLCPQRPADRLPDQHGLPDGPDVRRRVPRVVVHARRRGSRHADDDDDGSGDGHDCAAAAAGRVRLRPQRPELRVRRQRRVQGPDVRRSVRAADADVRSDARDVPGDRPGVRGRADAGSDRHGPDHVLPEVHLPGVCPDNARQHRAALVSRRRSARAPSRPGRIR